MAPKGLYSVQKSRSFGGTNNFNNTPPKDSETGRKTPNFDSLRKKFSRKKTSSFDDDDGGDQFDGTSSIKKNKNKQSKVGNILKWFKKDSKDNDTIYEEDQSNHSQLTPKINRLIHRQNEEPRFIFVNPKPFRSSSYDSICSIGSAASSFAFVPVNHYKVGKYVEPKKKIAIGINCGLDTYRKRLEQRDNAQENDRDLTLKTKYNLMSSDSPPTEAKKKLPNGPLLQSSELHRNDDTNSSSSGSDTDDTVEMESISQRGSPTGWSSAAPGVSVSCVDQQLGHTSLPAADQTLRSAGHCIKPRELSGQLLHPATIKPSQDRPEYKENCRHGQVSPKSRRYRSDSENGTLTYVTPTRLHSKFAQVGSTSNIPAHSELLPKTGAIEPDNRHISNNPFDDRVHKNSVESPRSSLSGDSDCPKSHIPGKRKAPEPPPRSQSPRIIRSPNHFNNPFLKKKGRAPPPPDKAALIPSSASPIPTNCNSLEGDWPGHRSELASGQGGSGSSSGSSRPHSRQTDSIKNNSKDSSDIRHIVMTGSAPTTPVARHKNYGSAEEPNSWILQDGLLRCGRESQQDIIASVEQEKESKARTKN